MSKKVLVLPGTQWQGPLIGKICNIQSGMFTLKLFY